MKKNRNYIDDMVEVFGYDYVIGFCLCSEHDCLKRAEREEDEERKAKLKKIARKFSLKCDDLIKERLANGL